MKKIIFFFAFTIYNLQFTISFSQPDLNKANQRYDESVVDKSEGITIYEKYNFYLGDEKEERSFAGIPCQAWVEDKYISGQLLHRGYYVDGRLKMYKNFYSNAIMEREYKNIGVGKNELTTFYSDGKLRTKELFAEDIPLKSEEYYPNGQLENIEEYHKRLRYFTVSQSYFESGKVESDLKLEDSKKLTFMKTWFYENGKIKEQGHLVFNSENQSYFKMDKWSEFSEDGKLLRETFFENGKMYKETNH